MSPASDSSAIVSNGVSSGGEDKAAPRVAVGVEADNVKGEENVSEVDNGTDGIAGWFGSIKKAREFPDVHDNKINRGRSQMTSHSFGLLPSLRLWCNLYTVKLGYNQLGYNELGYYEQIIWFVWFR